MTPTLTWKTHNGGKNHDSPQTAKCTMMKRLQTMGAQGQRSLVSPLPLPHAAVTTRRQLPLSLSLLSLSVQLTLYKKITLQQQQHQSMCPKSYLYIYDFSAYLHMCPSQLVGTDRNRFWDQPVLCIFHPEGHVSQQDLQCWINPFSMFSSIYSRRTSSSMGERLYIGPHEGSFPGCKSIGQSYGRCSSSLLAFTLLNASENSVYFFGS